MRFIFIYILFITSIFTCSGQYTIEWARGIGGDGLDEANCCVETKDGSLIIAGYTKQRNKEMWIVKLAADGTSIWGKTYPAKNESIPQSIVKTKDNCFVITGTSVKSNEFQSDLWVIKLDSAGNKIWEKFYGGPGSESGESIVNCKGGGFAIAGWSDSNREGMPDFWILKLDENGEKVWDKNFGGSKDDKAYGITQTLDGGYAAAGYTSTGGRGYRSCWVVKMDSLGNDQWSQVVHINNWDQGSAITSTSDSCIAVTGFTRTVAIIDYDAMTVKLDINGNELWRKVYGYDNWDEATTIIETFDHDIAVGGFSKSKKELKSSFLILKYNGKSGDLVWDMVFKRRSLDYSRDMVETRDNGLLLVGSTFSQGNAWDYAALKLKNTNYARITVNQPIDTITTSIVENFDLNLCVQNFYDVKYVSLFVNNILQVKNALESPRSNEIASCNYRISRTIKLNKGKNVIKMIATDNRNFSFSNTRVVYYLPSPFELW